MSTAVTSSPAAFKMSPEVAHATAKLLPVVALESTIISHGMPYPENVQMARKMEDIIRKAGAVPATCAIIKGVAKVGLTDEEIEHLGKEGQKVMKCSRRDIAYALAHGLDGACTVSATMMLSALAGVHVFATGGIGGVHRGAEMTWDVSADLREFSKSPVIVICAGAKAILDLPKTIEYLETEGVAVVGYKTLDLPAFYSSTSGIHLEIKADTPREIAEMHHISRTVLQSPYGMLVTNPIPPEFETPHSVIDSVIAQATKEAEEQGVTGKRITPFLLKRIVELTGGKSLQSNLALVENNVKLAIEIAKEYSKIQQEKEPGKKLKSD